jgi:pimeloyl-ACP methyl ester carboxylesterase
VVGPRGTPWLGYIEEQGVPSWARITMPGRFGTALPPAALEWWIELMSKTPLTTLQGYLRWVPGVDITQDVKSIRCPTLVITGSDGPLHKVEETASWQRTIADSELKVVPADCWHAGGAFPDVCAPATAEFFRRERLSGK